MDRSQAKPVYHQDLEQCVEDTLSKVGKNLVLALPIALGKPNPLVNAFYRRAEQDKSIRLKLMTGLSLTKPVGSNELERRFLDPFVKRVFGDYPELAYVEALRQDRLPSNIELLEFFFLPGGYLGVPSAQQNYISANYTHIARDLMDNGVNVIAQMIAKETLDGNIRYSLSCNSDITLDLAPLLRESKRNSVILGQVNERLPFMPHDAQVNADFFDAIIDHPAHTFDLFGPPHQPISACDYMIGLNASALIKDGGTLELGYGKLGDAVVYGLKLRHQQPEQYRRLLSASTVERHFSATIERIGGIQPFEEGLYGLTEMVGEGCLQLYQSGILKRKAYDHRIVQKLLNEKRIGPRIGPEILPLLLDEGLNPRISAEEFHALQKIGVFKEALRYAGGAIHTPEGVTITADLSDPICRKRIGAHCLGDRLKNGILIHGGFFLGPQSFYETLRQMSPEERQLICMTSISKTNQLYGADMALKRLQRKQARFINSALMVTLSGAVVADGLENGQVITGVGGQYNFVAMAHALRDGRSIIVVRSTRTQNGRTTSNIVWNYGHMTIPRHLRDIVVTEYGIAELRGKTDQQVIAELLNITDSRFQPALLQKAKRAGKLREDYQIPEAFCDNTPESLERRLRPFQAQGLFPDYPFGTELTDEERILAKTLERLDAQINDGKFPIKALYQALKVRKIPPTVQPYLRRLGLQQPKGFRNKLIQKLLVSALMAQFEHSQ